MGDPELRMGDGDRREGWRLLGPDGEVIRVEIIDDGSGGPALRPAAARPAGRAAWLATAVAVLMASVAVAQGGDGGGGGATTAGNSRGEPVEIQVRNRSRGETGLVTSSDDYSLRLSNTKENGGGGAVYGCRAPTATPDQERACLYADNLRGGEAFLFRSREGSKVGHFDLGNPAGAPFSTNATGLVDNLNADRLDSLHASDIVGQARAKAGLAAETADTATNADTVDGTHASGLRIKVATADRGAVVNTLDITPLELMNATITLDVPSTIVVNVMLELDSDGGSDDRVACRISRETFGNNISREPRADLPEGTFDRSWFGMTGYASLGAGTHNIKVFCAEEAGNTAAVNGNMWVLGIPN